MAKRYHDNKMSGMIREEHNDYANMPQEVHHKKYPNDNYPCPGGYRDNIEGIDAYARENHKTIMKQKRDPSTPY